jgi:hypothetical protein
MSKINCIVPARVCITGNPDNLDLTGLTDVVASAIESRLRFARATLASRCNMEDWPARFHDATITFTPDTIADETQADIEQAIREAVQKGASGHGASSPTSLFLLADYPTGVAQGTGPKIKAEGKPAAQPAKAKPKTQLERESEQEQFALYKITKLLSTSITDWVVTGAEAREALRILRGLPPEILLPVVVAMRVSGRWRTLLQKLPDSADLLDLQEKIDPHVGYIISGDLLYVEVVSRTRNFGLTVSVTREGITLPFLKMPVRITEMLPRDAPDVIAKAYIEEFSLLAPSIRLRVASRSHAYAPFSGPVEGEIWFSSRAIRDDSPEAKRRSKLADFAHYVAPVPTHDPYVVTALSYYYDWIDHNYLKPEFLSREPYDLWEWALKQSVRPAPPSPTAKFLELAHSIQALARQAPPEDAALFQDALGRYLAWLDAHKEDPKLSQIDPYDIWKSAYSRSLEKWSREQSERTLQAVRERKHRVDFQAVDRKLEEVVQFLTHNVWHLPEPEIAEDHTTGVGYLIMASEEERAVRDKVAREFLHDVVAQMLEPEFTSTPVRDDFKKWLGSHHDLYAQFLLAQSHPYVEHYAVGVDRPGWQTAIDTAISFIPIVGQIVAGYEVISGQDIFGNDLSDAERAILGAAVLLPAAARVFKGGRALVTTAQIARDYRLTQNEASALFRATAGIRPGSTAAKLLGEAAADLGNGRHITDAARIKQLETVLNDMGMMDPATAKSLKAGSHAGSEVRAVEEGIAGQGRAEARVAAESATPENIDRWIEEELAKADFDPKAIGGTPLPSKWKPVPARSFREALERADLKTIPSTRLNSLKAAWKEYLVRGGKRLKTEEDYIRYRYLHEIDEWPEIIGAGRELGAPGAIEQMAGHEMERFVDHKLPAGNPNTTSYPAGLPERVVPDHLPPGKKTVYLSPDGTVSSTPTGSRFSADFVGESKYRDLVPTDDQARGLVRLAQHSDQKKLVFYMRWQDKFRAVASTPDPHGIGFVLPPALLPSLVQAGIREEAAKVGVTIEVVSGPLMR